LSTAAASLSGTLAVTGATTLSSSARIGSDAYVGTTGVATILTNSTVLGATSELGLLIANDGTLNDLAQIGFGYSESRTGAVIAGAISNSSGSTTSDLLFATRAGTSGATAPTERMRITSAGRVGIGTTATSTAGNPLLQVNGSVSKETKAGSIAVSTPTTIFTLPNDGVFLVTTKQNDDVGTRSTAHLIFTETSGTLTRQVDLATGTLWTVTMSGLDVVLTNTSAFGRAYSASVLQLF
jgi:hypothetical protein